MSSADCAPCQRLGTDSIRTSESVTARRNDVNCRSVVIRPHPARAPNCDDPGRVDGGRQNCPEGPPPSRKGGSDQAGRGGTRFARTASMRVAMRSETLEMRSLASCALRNSL